VRVIGYTRVSTDGQAKSGAGLGAQRAAIREACKARGWELVRIATDTGSGKATASRVALNEALADLNAGNADALVASKLDRLSRNVPDFARMMAQAAKRGWSVVCLDVDVDTTTPSGELLLNVMSSFSQFERRVIGLRTKEGLAAKRASGVVLGRPSALDPAIRDRIVAERAAGRSLRAIATDLTTEGVATGHKGKQWYASSVRHIVNAA
jgi:DNA invertase Pin-like site-specific DNA recombinase